MIKPLRLPQLTSYPLRHPHFSTILHKKVVLLFKRDVQINLSLR
jgi:hypothetical protein